MTTSPRPWRRNPGWPTGNTLKKDPSPILDADGGLVMDPSEWLSMKEADIDLIISAVNGAPP